jgi:hypothetical protein
MDCNTAVSFKDYLVVEFKGSGFFPNDFNRATYDYFAPGRLFIMAAALCQLFYSINGVWWFFPIASTISRELWAQPK